MCKALPFMFAAVAPPQDVTQRPESPLLSQPEDSAPGSSYILHPPLPAVASPATSTGLPGVHIPLLLNPDILQSTSIPYISPQVSARFCVGGGGGGMHVCVVIGFFLGGMCVHVCVFDFRHLSVCV